MSSMSLDQHQNDYLIQSFGGNPSSEPTRYYMIFSFIAFLVPTILLKHRKFLDFFLLYMWLLSGMNWMSTTRRTTFNPQTIAVLALPSIK